MNTTLTVEEFGNDLNIVGGDLNLVLDIEKDKSGGALRTNERAASFVKSYMQMEDLVDIWHDFNPDKREFTWKRLNNPHP